jgi:C4-type Zn-finger protein
MSGETELCPKCKNGHLRPIAKASTNVESDEPFSPTVHMRDLECDNCSHRQKAASLTE